ncbi:hypothetical protein GDO86_002333 [Hymenochirus boettgeri]|uniref:Angiogenic factor with G patch and FHA domains 1 n=1 Tax=Hymenochirus boettgeri TaxID=247094 RepID=A0A8T2KM43_9PIPI|nr:hypothetical protein GDO86_002333 [Hymenochirus boettgeri]
MSRTTPQSVLVLPLAPVQCGSMYETDESREEHPLLMSGPLECSSESDGSLSPRAQSGEPDPTAVLGLRVRALETELKTCQGELREIQRQLNRSERLHRYTETHNQELRRQVETLSREIHDRKQVEHADQEVQTDDYYVWTESDYHYYSTHGNHYCTLVPETVVQSVTAGDNNATENKLEEYRTASSNQNVEEDQEGTECAQHAEEEQGASLADSLRATAEAAVSQTGFVYDESTGMYFDHSTGFYYDSESQLYYDPATGIYYYCDVDSGRYLFHSRVDFQSFSDPVNPQNKEKKTKKKRRDVLGEEKDSEMGYNSVTEREELPIVIKKAKMDSLVESCDSDNSSSSDESEPEEGEITNSDNEKASSDEDMESEDSVISCNSETEEPEKIWPPCIRVIVVRSPVLQKGSLFIITAVKNATFGREKDMGHTIRIPELGVSKFHAEVYFHQDLQSYVLVDQGSQNGTVINGNQILKPKEISEPYMLQHGDEVKFGETVLSFHVHPGSETCDGCEPGQVRAHLRLNNKEEFSAGPILSKEGKELLRRQGLKKIRMKYGLQSGDYEENKAVTNPKYKDRACIRRQKVGSEGTFQREDAPSSVHVEINESNKGRKMLEKMGWKKGEGLGKTGDGMRDPIQLQLRQKKAGLGSKNPTSIEDVRLKTRNSKNWEKARTRYAEAFPDAQPQNET